MPLPLRGISFFRNVKIAIVSKMAVLLTNPYVKKCFSREFVSEVPVFWQKSPAEISNRKLTYSAGGGVINVC
ncbi:hypothetical protein M2137_000330 [Parabacteroides sp. PFB2-10]|nr:hypothetical protein [Parabacteroides sp. PFB2-10]